MKRPPHHKFLLHGQGTGELTDDIIETRAQEIAAIHGRSAEKPTEEDRAEAWAELQGELLPAATDSDGESAGAITRDPSEPVSVPGRHVPNREPEDDSSATERLASEGVEEAQHDQMLAARRSEHRRGRL